ncbi:MAG: hypothetical protein N2450_07710, partial [bacterium]|nr:hypothetical protein [bacterium]
ACDLRTKMLGVWLTQKYNEEQKNCGLKEFFQNLFGVQFEHRAKVYLDNIDKVFSTTEKEKIYEFFHSIKPFQLGKCLEMLWG